MFRSFMIYSMQLVQSSVVWEVSRSRSWYYETIPRLDEYCAFPIFVIPLSRLMGIANDRFISLPLMGIANGRFISLPPFARLTSHHPFGKTIPKTQAGISARIRWYSVTFLWVCLMGLYDSPPEEDDLGQCSLTLYVVNMALCELWS